MTEVPKELKTLIFGRGSRWHAWVNVISLSLGLVCLIIGIIGDAVNRTPGLEPTNWFLLAIALGVFGLASWLTAYTAAKEG